jgi:hypothetical protein
MRCLDCGQEKPVEDFPRNRSSGTGRGVYCKPCHNARGRETRRRLYGGSRHYHLKRRYGIGAADFDALLTEQGMLCPICLKRPAEHVDHDHKTKKVRGILCEQCNGGLGQFKDNVQTIRNAIEYLGRNRGTT